MTTTSGSSIISALGAGSGVDFIKLASDISAASFAAQRSSLTARQTALEAQISAAGQLRGAITGLASALGDRIRSGDLAPKPELANPAVAKVTVPAGLSPRGNFALEVTQLAQGQTLVGRPYANRDALVGEGTLTLRFGTVGGAAASAPMLRAARDRYCCHRHRHARQPCDQDQSGKRRGGAGLCRRWRERRAAGAEGA